MRRAESYEGGDKINAVGIRDGTRHGFCLGRVADDLQFIAQPLDSRTGDEDAAFERVGCLAVALPADRSQQARIRVWNLRSSVHQQEAACPVGVLDGAALEALVAKE